MYQNSITFNSRIKNLLFLLFPFLLLLGYNQNAMGQCNAIVSNTAFTVELTGPSGIIDGSDMAGNIDPDGNCMGGATYLFFTSLPGDGDMGAADLTYDCSDIAASPITAWVVIDDNADGTYDLGSDATPVQISITVADVAAPVLIDPMTDCTSLDQTLECGPAVTAYLATLDAAVQALYEDNCTMPPIVTRIGDNLDQPCPGDATRIIDYRIEDATGNSTTCSVTLTIEDTDVPTWDNPQGGFPPVGFESYTPATNIVRVRLDCDDPDLAAQIAAWEAWTPMASDVCNSTTVSLVSAVDFQVLNVDPPTGTCRVQRRDVTWTAEDECGNSVANDLQVRIRVFDTSPPVFDPVSSNESVNNDPGVCQADLTASGLLARTAMDCQTLAPGDYTYSISITSASPTIAEFEALNGAGSLMGSDNNANLIYPVGTYTITYSVSDPCSNGPATHTISFEVVDNEPAMISGCPADIVANTVPGDCSNTLSWTPPTAMDNCDDTGITVAITTDRPSVIINSLNPLLHFAQFPKGVTNVTYTFTDINMVMTSCTFMVTINDNEAPTFDDCDDQELLSICPDAAVPDYTSLGNAQDNCPMLTVTQSPTAGTTLGMLQAGGLINPNPPGTLQNGATFDVTLTATDMAGNTDQCTFTVTLRDEDKPIPDVDPLIDINSMTTLFTDCGEYELCAPTATDCNGVTIYGTATIAGAILDPNGCGAGKPSYTFTGPGVWAISWIYDDGNGNISTQTQNVEIEDDTTDPTLNCPMNVTVPTDPGVCTTSGIGGIDMTEIVPTVTPYLDPADNPAPGEAIDDCGIDQFSYALSGATVLARTNGANAGIETFNLGTTTVTYYAVDEAGNEGSCSFDVTVEDNQAPTIACPANDFPPGFFSFMILLETGSKGDPAGDCVFEVVGDYLDLSGVSDNCSIVDTMLTITPILGAVTINNPSSTTLDGTTFDLSAGVLFAMVSIEWKVTDGSGLMATCTRTLMIRDGEDPVITCPADQTRGISEDGMMGDCVYTVQGKEFDPDPADLMDNCDTAFTFNSYNFANSLAGEDFPIGTTTVTWTVADLFGNTATCDFDITIEDDEDPVFTYCPADVTLNNTTNECSQLHTWDEPTVFDLTDCDILANLSIRRVSSNGAVDLALNTNYPYNDQVFNTALAEFPVGETYVYYIASDGSGNEDTCKLKVTVLDTEAPQFVVCPGDQDLESICADAVVPDYTNLATVTDNCSGYTLTQDPAAGTLLADVPGLTPADGETFMVTLTATDQNPNGGSTDCTFTVTLDDQEAPIPDIAGPSLPSIYNSCSEVIVTAPTATDCGLTIYGTPSQGSFLGGNPPQYSFTTGSYNVTWTYIDADNNASFQSQVITVVDDNTPPQLTCPVPAPMYGTDEPNCTASGLAGLGLSEGVLGGFTAGTYADTCTTDPNFTVEYELTGATIVARKVGSNAGTETFNNGTTTVRYWVTDEAGNTSSCSFDVVVMDDDAPIFDNLPANVSVDCDDVPAIPTVTATDNCDGTLTAMLILNQRTDGVCDDSYTLTRRWEVSDAKGNSTTGTQIITVTDMEDPVFNLSPGDKDVTVSNDLGQCGANVILQILPGEVSDNCDNDVMIVNDYTANGANATAFYPVGTTIVTFTATDNCGRTATYTATVVVNDDEDPTIGCVQGLSFNLPDTDTLVLRPEDLYFVLRDNCGNPITVTMDRDTFTCDDISDVPHPVTLTATDQYGNTGTCTTTVKIEDNINPVAVCQDITVEVGNDGTVTVNATSLDNGSTDNCDNSLNYYINVLGSTSQVYDCSDLGSNVAVLIVEDPSGNIASCNATITVEDNIDPVAVCNDFTLNLDASGNGLLTPSDVDASSSDNCAIASLAVSPNTFDCSDLGPNTVTLTVTDQSGNIGICTATVTVVDNTNPDAMCMDTTVYLDASGNVTIDYTYINGGSTDACGNLTFSHQENFNCLDTGDNVVTLTVQDGSGNTDQCDAIVTVLDTIAPIASCNDVTVFLDEDGTGEINVNDVWDAVNSSDNCGIEHARLDRMTFDCSDKNQMNPVILSLEDGSGNIGTCTANVTVLDITAPHLECRDITVAVSDGQPVMIYAGTVIDSVYDACGIQDTFINNSVFDCNDLGTSQVLVTATDFTGNTNTCIANVTVVHDGNPTAVCQDITVELGEDGTLGEATVNASEIDNGSTNACGNAIGLSLSLSQTTFDCDDIGDNTVTLTVTDQFGNSSTCTATVTVEAPELSVTIANSSGAQGDIISVPITVDNFVEITSLQFTVEVSDLSVARIDATTLGTPGAGATLIRNSDGIASYQFNAPGAVPVTHGNGTVIGYLEIELLGVMGESTPLVFTSSQNAMQWSSDCQSDTGVQSGFDANDGSATVSSSAAMFTVSGNIASHNNGIVLANVPVEISYGGVPSDTVYTDASGNFSFMASSGTSPTFCPLSIKPDARDERDFYLAKFGGDQYVSAFDQLKISQHIFNIDRIMDPYYLIAADVSETAAGTACVGSEINGTDIAAINTVLAGAPSWPHDAWVFVPTNHVFADPLCPWAGASYPECRTINNISSNQTGQDFYGIKIGDVNGDFNSNDQLNGGGSDSRAESDLRLEMFNNDGVLEFRAATDMNIGSIQFGLNLGENISAEDVLVAISGYQFFNVKYVENQSQLIVFAYDMNMTEVNAGTLLFSINSDLNLDMVTLSDDLLINEVYSEFGGFGKIILEEASVTSDENFETNAFELLQNTPNPFTAETQLSWILPYADQVNLRIYSELGQEVLSRTLDGKPGLNTFTVNGNDLPHSGTYFYQIVTNDFEATKSLVLTK